MSAATLATLNPAQRLERTHARKLLSQRRRRARAEQFFTAAAPLPPRRDTHRDYLFDPKGRDIIRV
jgi:hypothetical protein